MKINFKSEGENGKKKNDIKEWKDKFHFWVEAENVYPWLIIMVVDYLRVFNLYFQVVICFFFSDAIISIPGLKYWNIQYSIFHHDFFSVRPNLKINFIFHQYNFYNERYL